MHFYTTPNEPYDFIETSKNRWHTAYIRRLIAEAKQLNHTLQVVSMVGSTIESLIEEKTFLETESWHYQKKIDGTRTRRVFHLIEADGWNCFVVTTTFGSLFFFQKDKGGIIYHATEKLVERFAQFRFHPANYHPHYFLGAFQTTSPILDNSFYDQDDQIRASMIERVNWVLFNDEPEKPLSQEEAFLSLAEEAFILVSEAADPETFYQSIKCHPDLDFLEDITPMVIYLAQFFAEYEEVEIVRGLAKGEYVVVNNDYTSVCNIVESHLSTKRSYASNMEREYASLRTYIIDYRKKNTSFQRRMTTK